MWIVPRSFRFLGRRSIVGLCRGGELSFKSAILIIPSAFQLRRLEGRIRRGGIIKLRAGVFSYHILHRGRPN